MQFSGDPLEVDPYLCCGRFQTQDLFMQQVLLGCICNASSRRECFGHVAICIHSHPGTTAMATEETRVTMLGNHDDKSSRTS
ncbi:uncharacterized protein LOC142587336 isoform X6 [Dermacentor variabilis]|uniref:uncharacterized protein LOC142587336 isoform X6 n=1 Tax=Dermacentor variabilis TaxID=34621 RepID=UPI003F5BE943